jgi:hypothetical protein
MTATSPSTSSPASTKLVLRTARPLTSWCPRFIAGTTETPQRHMKTNTKTDTDKRVAAAYGGVTWPLRGGVTHSPREERVFIAAKGDERVVASRIGLM